MLAARRRDGGPEWGQCDVGIPEWASVYAQLDIVQPTVDMGPLAQVDAYACIWSRYAVARRNHQFYMPVIFRVFVAQP